MSRWIPATGIANPVGPVVELVAELVDGLLELEDGQHPFDRRLARRQQRRVDSLEVALEEAFARTCLPVLGRLGPARERRGGGRVGEGAQHPGDVSQRRALAAALDERPRRLALEVDDHPVAVRPEGLAEVVVAVRADHAAGRAGLREQAQLLPHLLAATEDRREPLVVLGQLEEDAGDLLVDGRGQQAQRLDARLLGRERRIVRIGGEDGVHLAGHLAEPAQPVEEALRGGARLVERELPAVGGRGHVLLEDAERRRELPARVAVPAGERGDVVEAALAEEAQHLQLRVGARLEPPEELQDQRLVEDDRAVRLVGADEASRAELAGERREVVGRAELDDPVVALQRQAPAHRAHELARQPRILGEAVDPDLAAEVRVEQLVDVVRAGLVAQLDDRERELGIGGADDDRVEHLRGRDGARLGAVPALPGDVVDELGRRRA